ncbi:MAG: CCA tRNA nucleotidyltransferase [Acidobacteriota bacterium]|nr:CCA tRNA nucleotidyltransferase [Acidobacteriota bacterium]
MADYIYTMETRLSPEQMRVVNTVQNLARVHGMNVYLTGGATRDILTGFPIRDLDFTIQGNPVKLQAELERLGGVVDLVDQNFSVIHAVIGGVRAEISMARAEVFDKPGKPPAVTPSTINEDLRRRDFTCNAMALSLSEGSRGLLLDPFNGTADIESKQLRVLHSYAFLEDPSRLIRATRFAARFGWELEERTKARYQSAVEGEYIQFLNHKAIGYEIEQVALEENPIPVMKALEAAGWLKVLCAKWTAAKVESEELSLVLKTRELMAGFNITVDAAPSVMHFLTHKLGEAEVSAIQKQIPHREFVAAWKRLENDAKDLSKKLLSKEAAQTSVAWKILSEAKPEALLYLDVTGRNKTVDEKIKNFFGKWRQLQEKIPYAQMTELRITPQLPEYPQICQEAFTLLLDGKLRNDGEIAKFLAPYEPPPPPPPPTPVRRGRGAKKAAKAAAPAKEAVAASTVEVEVAKEAPAAKHAVKKAAAKAKPAEIKPALKKAEVHKAEVHKAEAKPVAKKAEVKKPEPKKPETKKPEPKKPASKKPAAKAVAAKPKAKVAAKPVKPAKKAAAKPAAKKTAPKPEKKNEKHGKKAKGKGKKK